VTSVKSVASAEWADTGAQEAGSEARPLLAAIATVLRETVAAFEATVGRITEITVTRPGRADRDLVVTLQDFDRLQQEFATLSEVLGKLSAAGGGSYVGAEALADISIADLKDRLARHLRMLSLELPAADTAEEVEF
jgi:hypothetical protein